MLHVPVLRAGRPYRSLDTVRLRHVKTGEPVAEVSLANRGLVARDLGSAAENREILQKVPVASSSFLLSRWLPGRALRGGPSSLARWV